MIRGAHGPAHIYPTQPNPIWSQFQPHYSFCFFFFLSHPTRGWDHFLNVSLLTEGWMLLAHNKMDNLPIGKKKALEVKTMKSRIPTEFLVIHEVVLGLGLDLKFRSSFD